MHTCITPFVTSFFVLGLNPSLSSSLSPYMRQRVNTILTLTLGPQVLIDFLSIGCSVLLSDVDVIWLNDPFSGGLYRYYYYYYY